MAGALNFLLIGCLLQGALCQTFEVTIPEKIKVHSGSCVTIPCSFKIESKNEADLDRTCKAIWKNNGEIVFDSTEQTGIKGKLWGVLTEKDCTTSLNNVFPGDTFSLRLECENQLKYSFKKTSQISIKDDPFSATLTPSTLKVKEGSSVSLNCSAPVPCLSHPPTLTWTPGLGDSQETLQEKPDKTKVKTSVLTFTASHLHHRQNISCTAVYNKQDGSTELSVSTSLTADVAFAPKILSSSDCTKTADQLNCSCKTVGNPSPTLQWYLNGFPVNQSVKFAISNEPLNDTGLRSFIIVTQPQWKDLSTLQCQSSNSLGSARQRFCVNSLEPQTSAESHGQVTWPVFIATVGVLMAALVCALLFAIRAQRTGRHNSTENQCTGDTSTAVTSQGLTSEKGNKMSTMPEEDIYANTNMMRESENHRGHQRAASQSSEKNEKGGDVIYTSVLWKSKKKKRGRSGDRNPSGISYLEEERRMEGGKCRSVVNSALEMESLYDNVVTGKGAKKAVCDVNTG